MGLKIEEILAEVKEVEANLKGSETMARPVEVVRKWEIINKYRDSQGQSNRIAQPGIDQIEPITQTSMLLTHKWAVVMGWQAWAALVEQACRRQNLQP